MDISLVNEFLDRDAWHSDSSINTFTIDEAKRIFKKI